MIFCILFYFLSFPEDFRGLDELNKLYRIHLKWKIKLIPFHALLHQGSRKLKVHILNLHAKTCTEHLPMDLTKILGLNSLHIGGKKLTVKVHNKPAGLFLLTLELGSVPKPAQTASSCSDLTSRHRSCPFYFKLIKWCHNRQLFHSNEHLKCGDLDWILGQNWTTFTDFISIHRWLSAYNSAWDLKK